MALDTKDFLLPAGFPTGGGQRIVGSQIAGGTLELAGSTASTQLGAVKLQDKVTIGDTAPTIASSTSTVTWDPVQVGTMTATMTGTETVPELAMVRVMTPTIAGSACTITKAGTLVVNAAPTASGSVTITTAYSLWVKAGKLQADGNATIGGATSTISFFGAAGATKVAVTGSKGANAALTALMTALANLGLVTDSTS